jgi:hypothetical protein
MVLAKQLSQLWLWQALTKPFAKIAIWVFAPLVMAVVLLLNGTNIFSTLS